MGLRGWTGLLVAGGLIAGLAWTLRPAARGHGTLLPPRGPATGATEAAALAPGGGSGRAELVRTGPRTAPAEELAGLLAGDTRVVEGAVPDDRVVVRVRLVDLDGEPFYEPDQSVELVTWERESDVDTAHRSPLLREGWAEFEFEGAVHVEHARYEPSTAGLAFGYVEVHEDLEPGSWYEMVLGIGAGSIVFGRVEREDGAPLAGVEVDAYGGDYEDRVHGSWKRGLLTAKTDAAGEFRFVDLPEGWWYVCVPVIDWLQLTPNIWEEPAGRFAFALRPGMRVDAGVFRVTPAERFFVRAVDAAGTPLSGVEVELTLLEPESPAIELLAEGEEGWERWLNHGLASGETAVARGERRSGWDYGVLSEPTGEDGSVRVAAIAGTWRLQMRLPLACEGEAGVHDEVIRVPSPDRRVVLPAVLASWGGVVRSRRGEPLRWARVQLRRPSSDCGSEAMDLTDAEGRFEMNNVFAEGPFSVRVSANGYLPLERDLGARLGQPATFELQESASLQLLLVGANGLPVEEVMCVLEGGEPAPGVAPEVWSAFWSERRGSAEQARAGGGLTVTQLLPGEYECRLIGTGSRAEDEEDLGRYVLATDAGPRTIVLPVEGVRPTKPQVHEHAGLVVDARTGKGISEARVMVGGANAVDVEFTGRDGSFELELEASEVAFVVQAPGYLPEQRAGVQVRGERTEHVFRLTPLESSLELLFETSDGARLPSVDLALRDRDGRPVAAFLEGAGWWITETTSEAGRVVLAGLAPGPLQLEVGVFDISLGTYPIVVPDGEGRHTVTVRLEEDADDLRDAVLEAYEEDD